MMPVDAKVYFAEAPCELARAINRCNPNGTRLTRKQERDLPELMERVTAACEARLQAGQKITHHAIGKDLGLFSNWTHYQWREPAVRLVDGYIDQRRPQDAEPPAAGLGTQGFFFDNNRGRNWAKPLKEPQLLKRCYFTGEPDPGWQVLLFHKARGWEHWCYASAEAIDRLRDKHLNISQEADMANIARMQELEAKLNEVLADIQNVNPLNKEEIRRRCGGAASFLSMGSEVSIARRRRVESAIKAELDRRAGNVASPDEASASKHTQAEQEALIDAIHPELAQPQPDLTAELEQLRQQLEVAERRCEALQQANEQLAEQPAYKPPVGEIEAVQAQLQQEQESLLARLREVEAELAACDRLQSRLGKKPLRLAS